MTRSNTIISKTRSGKNSLSLPAATSTSISRSQRNIDPRSQIDMAILRSRIAAAAAKSSHTVNIPDDSDDNEVVEVESDDDNQHKGTTNIGKRQRSIPESDAEEVKRSRRIAVESHDDDDLHPSVGVASHANRSTAVVKRGRGRPPKNHPTSEQSASSSSSSSSGSRHRHMPLSVDNKINNHDKKKSKKSSGAEGGQWKSDTTTITQQRLDIIDQTISTLKNWPAKHLPVSRLPADLSSAVEELARHVERELIRSAHTLSEYLDKSTFSARLLAAHAQVAHRLIYPLTHPLIYQHPFTPSTYTNSHTLILHLTHPFKPSHQLSHNIHPLTHSIYATHLCTGGPSLQLPARAAKKFCLCLPTGDMTYHGIIDMTQHT